MSICDCCNQPIHTEILPSYRKDLGGITVRLIDSVTQDVCDQCKEAEITIPDLPGLIKAVAVALVVSELKLDRKAIRFLRKVLDLQAKELAKRLGVTAETVSRWENGRETIGPISEKLLRLIVGLNLSPFTPKDQIDINRIPSMDIRSVREIREEEPLCFHRVPISEDNSHCPKWHSETNKKAA